MKKDDRIRVLYCEQNVDGTIGGSYYSLLYLVQHLDRLRYEPIVVFYTEHSLLPTFRELGIDARVWRRPQPFRLPISERRWLRLLSVPLLALQKFGNLIHGLLLPAVYRAWFLTTMRIDLVHLNNSILRSHDWMLGARLAGVPCLTHERGINHSYPPSARYFAKHLAAIICISEAVRRNLVDEGVDSGNLVTIHNGFDPAMSHVTTPPREMRSAYGIPDDAPTVVMVGNFKAWKGQDTVVRAIHRVHHAYPRIRCVFVGDTAAADRAYEHSIRTLVSSLELGPAVIFAGFQRNVADFLAMADIVVHASTLPEPFGRVLLEAMACRKPVVGTAAGGVVEIVQDGHTGLTFPPGDAERLAAILTDLISEPGRARRLGENGYNRLVHQFGLARNVEATERVYAGLFSAAH